MSFEIYIHIEGFDHNKLREIVEEHTLSNMFYAYATNPNGERLYL
jgi:hypothetical protein